MRAIWKREWKALFHGMWGYGFLGLFALAVGVTVTLYHFVYGYTNVEFGLPYYGVALALTLPLMTVPLFRGDHKGEGRQLIRMLPVTAKEWVVGKLLCPISIWSLACGILAVLPLIVSLFGTAELPSAYVSLLVLYLLGLALLMIEIFLSMSLKNTAAAWILSYGVPVALFVIHKLCELLPSSVLGTYLSYLSLFGGTTPFVFSFVDLRVVALYVSVFALFFLLSYRRGVKLFDGQERKTEEKRGLWTVAWVLVAALALNLAVGLIPGRFRTADVSEAGYYTLQDGTKAFLDDLDEDVTLYLIDADGDDQRFEYFLERMAQYSPHLTLKTVPLADSGELLAKVGATVDQMASVGYCIVAESQKRVEIIDYNSLFYYETQNSSLQQLGLTQMSVSEYYSWINNLYSYANQNEGYLTYLEALLYDTYMKFQGQGILCSMLEYVTADVIPHAYVLTGHGETEFSSSLISDMVVKYGRQYDVLDLNAVSQIPAEVSCLLILAPTEDYSAAEIEMLRAYLDRGGQITLVTSAANLAMPNLMSLTAAYGMSATTETVGIDVEVKNETAEGEEPTISTERSSAVKVTANVAHDAFAVGVGESSLAPVITNGNAISFTKTDDPSLTHGALLTTEKAYLGEDSTTAGRYVLAAAAETSKGAHLLWFTGAESYTVSMTNGSVDADYVYNVFCLYMVEAWSSLNYRSHVEMPEATLYQLEYSSPSDAQTSVFGILLIGAIPLTLIVSGALIRYKRKKA